MSQNLKFVFFGTPDVASKTLEILKGHGYVPSLIVTAPDRPVGRHFVMTPSPTKEWADAHGITVLQPEKITDEFVADLKAKSQQLPTDLFIVVAYGKILPQSLIDIPKLGTLNIHYSLLPRWRGASPVEAAILAGDLETGVSIQKMVFKLDAGPVIAEEKIAIEPDDTTLTLREKLITIGGNLLARVIPSYVGRISSPSKFDPSISSVGVSRSDGVVLVEQDESNATHCGKTKKEDGLVDPFTDDPKILWRKYRAYQPWPGLYFFDTPKPASGEGGLHDGKRIKITQAIFEDGKFVIKKVIPEGKKEMDW